MTSFKTPEELQKEESAKQALNLQQQNLQQNNLTAANLTESINSSDSSLIETTPPQCQAFVVKSNSPEQEFENLKKLKTLFNEFKDIFSKNEQKKISFDSLLVKNKQDLIELEKKFPNNDPKNHNITFPCRIVFIKFPNKQVLNDFMKKPELKDILEPKKPASSMVEHHRNKTVTPFATELTPQEKNNKEEKKYATPTLKRV